MPENDERTDSKWRRTLFTWRTKIPEPLIAVSGRSRIDDPREEIRTGGQRPLYKHGDAFGMVK
jgi:hypothetical protein